MKDILQSAERETNNPAAGSDLSQDELVMFLYSPDELATIRSPDGGERKQRTVAQRVVVPGKSPSGCTNRVRSVEATRGDGTE